MEEFKLTVSTYYGAAHCKQKIVGDMPDFDAPDVPVLIHEAGGVRIVLGTHDFHDLEKPDIQIERRPKGWAIFLHPEGGCDPSGYVYFLDDGRSFLLRENSSGGSGSIEVLRGHKERPEIDEMELPEPDIRGAKPGCVPGNEVPGKRFNLRRHSDGLPAQAPGKKPCARCGQVAEDSGDWFDDLCPGCADKTDGDWHCRSCNRHGSFEAMGGDGATNPICCGVPCQHIDPDESVG